MDKLELRARYTQALNILDSLGTLNSYGILDSYGTSQPMMTGATMAASHPQLIAPASTSDRGPPVLRSTPPTYVIGSQGLPSAPGRPAAPVAAKNTAIPVKDADGRFPCPHCTKTYLHTKHLKRHLLRHTGERPYKCVLCDDTFSRSDILKRHFQKCSTRRGNPTGASHLSHPVPVQDGMNSVPSNLFVSSEARF